MKKSFSYNLTQFGATDNTVTEQIKTSDGVKTITTDANTGAVILTDSIDEDSLNPVTGAAVATAIAGASGASGEVPVIGDGDNGKVLKAVVDGSSKSVAWGDDMDNAYVATYGVTTYQELSDAKTAGKAIFVVGVSGATSAVMPMTSFSSNPMMVMFSAVIGSSEYQVKIDQGVWSSESVSLQANWNESNQLAPSYIANKPTVDQIYDSASTNAQSGTAVAGAISGVRQVPSTQSSDNGKVLGVTDASGTLGWVSAGGSVVVDSHSPFNGSGTAASPLGFNFDSDSLNVSANSIGPIAYADASFTGDSAIGTILDTSTTVTMTFAGVGGYAQPGDSAYIVLTYGSNNSISSRTSGTIANDRSVTLTINVHDANTRYGTWTADSTLYTIKIWDIQESSYASYTNVTIVDPAKRLRINRPVPVAQSADNGKVLSVTDSSGSIGWANVNIPSELPSYTSSDWGKVLSVKQESQGSSSSVVYWTNVIPGGQTLGSADASVVGSTLTVTCDTIKSALYNLVCIVPNLRVDASLVDMDTEYYLDLNVNGGTLIDTYRISIKFYLDGNAAYPSGWSDSSTVMYRRLNGVSSVSIASLTKADGTAVTGDWLLPPSDIYVYGLA